MEQRIAALEQQVVELRTWRDRVEPAFVSMLWDSSNGANSSLRASKRLECIELLMELAPEYKEWFQARSRRGQILSKLGRYEEALNEFRAALEANPSAEDRYERWAVVEMLHKLDRDSDALAAMPPIDTVMSYHCNMLAEMLYKAERYQEVLTVADAAEKKMYNPSSGEAVFMLRGRALREMGRIDEAIDHFSTILKNMRTDEADKKAEVNTQLAHLREAKLPPRQPPSHELPAPKRMPKAKAPALMWHTDGQ